MDIWNIVILVLFLAAIGCAVASLRLSFQASALAKQAEALAKKSKTAML